MNMRTRVSVANILFLITASQIFLGVCREASAQNTPPPVPKENIAEFAGIKFGVGLSLTVDLGKNERVSDAEVVNGIVRVEKESDTVARLMLEMHYFFTPCFGKKYRDKDGNLIDRYGHLLATNVSKEKGKEEYVYTALSEERVTKDKPPYDCTRFIGLEQGQYAIGPFIAIQPGTNEIIEAIGGGFMLGLRRKEGLGSFNLGLGFVVDPSVQVLGSGIKENQPLPQGETQIRFKEKTQAGLLIIGSFSW